MFFGVSFEPKYRLFLLLRRIFGRGGKFSISLVMRSWSAKNKGRLGKFADSAAKEKFGFKFRDGTVSVEVVEILRLLATGVLSPSESDAAATGVMRSSNVSLCVGTYTGSFRWVTSTSSTSYVAGMVRSDTTDAESGELSECIAEWYSLDIVLDL